MAKVINSMDGILRSLIKQSEKEVLHGIEDAMVQEFMVQAEATIRPRVRELVKTISIRNIQSLYNVSTMKDDLTIYVNINGETEDKS